MARVDATEGVRVGRVGLPGDDMAFMLTTVQTPHRSYAKSIDQVNGEISLRGRQLGAEKLDERTRQLPFALRGYRVRTAHRH